MRKIITLLFLLISLVTVCLGQGIAFHSLTTETGLSHNSVTAIFQDGKGAIWIGTREGLNRYNGNRVQQFREDNYKNVQFVRGYIKAVTGNGIDKVYVLTNEGISVFDDKTGQFKVLVKGAYYQMACIRGILYIMDKKQIFIYDEAKNEKRLYFSLPEISLSLKCFLIDRSGQLWIGTEKGGLLVKDSSNKTVRKVIDNINVTQVYQDSRGEVWIGSWNDGLFRIVNGKTIRYRHSETDKNSISSDFVRCFMEDEAGNMWIGSFRGLDKLERSTGRILSYDDGEENGGLKNSSIWSIIKDRQGTIWVGTYFGGVNYFNPKYEIYDYFKKSIIRDAGLSSSVVAKMTEDNQGNLWICTEGGGLNRYNLKTGKFKWFKSDKHANSISQDNLKAIYFDPKQNALWIGTHLGGLNRMNLTTGKFTCYLAAPQRTDGLPSNVIQDIVPHGDKLILATPLGVGEFDPHTGQYKRLLDTDAFSLLIDREGVLWVGGLGSGAFAYHFNTGEFQHYSSEVNKKNTLSDNFITRIIQDHQGKLWFATSSAGLCLFQPSTDDFKRINLEMYGVSSNYVYDLVESSTGNLLIATNKSFVVYNPKENSFNDYRYDHGFPLGAMNENGLYLSRSGRIFLGGVSGMVSFNEQELIVANKPYSLRLQQITVNNSNTKSGVGNKVLIQGLYYEKEVVLNSDQTTFDIEWVTDNYILENKDNIIYQLHGFSDKWNDARENTPISYTNLSPGSYVLIVKSTRSGGPETRLAIKISPPFYRTTLAYICYILLFAGLMYYIFRFYRSRIRLQESLRYEKLHARELEILNDSKINFFTNVSHEFRTPLTLISVQIEQILSRKGSMPAEFSKKISAIYNCSKQLDELVTELMDFRKQEEGLNRIYPSEVDLTGFISNCFQLFRPLATIKEIDYDLLINVKALKAFIDIRQMRKVMNNLLSNAFKNTPVGGKIVLSLTQQGEHVALAVEDSGPGIPPDEINRIFEPFYQTSESVLGTGIGLSLARGVVELHQGKLLVKSELSIGTTFIVQLPLKVVYPEGTIRLAVSNQFKDSSQSEIKQLQEQDIEIASPEIVLESDQRKKILIVEDNPAIREVLVDVFAEFYEVETADDGQAGWVIAQDIMPDIIVSDVVMPNLSGIDLCKKLKSDYATSHIPLVLLTARASIEYNLEGLLVGADDYIPKPFNARVLLTRCNNLVNNRILLQEKFSKQPAASVQILATTQIDKEFLERATSIIERNIDDPDFNVNIFSREMGIARTNLFSKLKGITGQTPNEFTLTIRLKQAALMLKTDPKISVSEISENLGFTSAKYFSKCFKDCYQITPLHYRKQFFSNTMDND
ncbi:response regulator [Pedobacter sp. HDW13]|uniref:hybrid sensor histidine kinase/response regulator n=1 Tax=Pedobacter sp. HDW13 TaxID=2714940 RepID=UPI00140E1501|nr:two-component regulator propeller domain-containing protein [Pedobacter sp. HDW13]QIL38351.1 response regulator [Pedobacter sp. HDW13]